jgi:hypothetical protein
MTEIRNTQIGTRVTYGDPCNRQHTHFPDLGAVSAGTWHRVVIRGKWESNTTGIFQFWYDGVKKVDKTGIATFPNTTLSLTGVYGLYANGWHDQDTMVGTQGTRDVYYDSVRVASTYDEADPAQWGGGNPTPTAMPTATATATPTGTSTATPTATATATPCGSCTLVEVTPPASGVTASTHDGNVPGNTVDNNLTTRWSANGDGAWIQYDLGSVRTLALVKIAAYNGNTRRNRFDLQVSTGGGVWSNVLTGAQTGGTTTVEEAFDFPDVDARYVRYVGHMSTASTFNSLTEVSLIASSATPTSTPVPSATPTATDPPADVEITPGAASVTASTNDGNVPGNAVDGNLGTRWSASGDGQWLRLDLGSTRTVAYVAVGTHAGNTRRARFDLQVSSTGTTWTNVLTNVESSGTTTAEETFDFPDTSARYVRYLGHGNSDPAKASWNSVAEISVFGH